MGALVIAGDRSGSGKTTVTLALLAALGSWGTTVQAFKVGPDYIDPMFHRAITRRPAYNLDPVLTSETYVQQCFQQHSATADCALIEGVMGLFDGAGGSDTGSTAHVARLLGSPVVLVVDCARLSRSLAAIVQGYRTWDPRLTLAGVVLNRVGSDRHLAMLTAAISPLAVPVLGVLRRDDVITLPDRHLGLVPTDELTDLPARLRHLATLGQRCFNWAQLTPLLQRRSPGGAGPDSPGTHTSAAAPVRIGIARDRAFNFYYEDNLTLLTRLGAELVPFSPLADTALPPALAGLYLGGGFPELFAADLAQNQPLRQTIAQQLQAGLPTYAECGGLMYLCQTLQDFQGQCWPMVGALPATSTMTSRLTLGYRQVQTQQASPLVIPGQQFWGHEFHRSRLTAGAPSPLYRLTPYPGPDPTSEVSSASSQEGWANPSLHASYVHVHWGDRPALPQRLLAICRQWQQNCGQGHENYSLQN